MLNELITLIRKALDLPDKNAEVAAIMPIGDEYVMIFKYKNKLFKITLTEIGK